MITITEIRNDLLEGLGKNEREKEQALYWLIGYSVGSGLTLEKLSERVWEDSNWFLDRIY